MSIFPVWHDCQLWALAMYVCESFLPEEEPLVDGDALFSEL